MSSPLLVQDSQQSVVRRKLLAAVGVVVSSFYEIRAALDSNKSEALSIRSQLQELQQYMKERFVEFVPTLGSGSGGGPEYFRPVTA